MRFKPRVIRKRDGSLEVKLTINFTPREVDALYRIPDSPHENPDLLRKSLKHDDQFLMWLRILVHWARIWENRDNHREYIQDCVTRRRRGVSQEKRK